MAAAGLLPRPAAWAAEETTRKRELTILQAGDITTLDPHGAIHTRGNPWIVVLQPYEDCGLRRYVEFTASPDQRVELRRFNFALRRG